jgi:hypothetical protein
MELITGTLFLINLIGTCTGAGTTIAGAVNAKNAKDKAQQDQAEGASNITDINADNELERQANWLHLPSH